MTRVPSLVFTFILAIATAMAGSSTAIAAPFEVAASPSRFLLSGKSAQRVGQSLEIYNVGAIDTEVTVRTIDWRYSPEGNITYVDALEPDSCRPWVTLERKSVKIPARGKQAFRFQIDVPADAAARECRFMLAIEGMEPAQQALIQNRGASLALPVSGRLAVTVYVAVNGATPKLALSQVGVADVKGKRTPMVTVSNTGTAHGRLDGSLDAVDAKGLKFELIPESTPILPGQTRVLPLSVKVEPGMKAAEPVWPIKSSGSLDWEEGSFKVNAEFR